MFLFRASRYLEELRAYQPEIFAACELATRNASLNSDFVCVNEEAFAACPANSVDYAVMEKTADSVVVRLEAGWNDIGSWSSLWEVGEKDANGNVVFGDVKLLALTILLSEPMTNWLLCWALKMW